MKTFTGTKNTTAPLSTKISNGKEILVVGSASAKRAASKAVAKIKEADMLVTNLTPVGRVIAQKRLLLADDLLTKAATELDSLELSEVDRHMRRRLLHDIETIGYAVEEKQALDWWVPLPTPVRRSSP